MRYKRQNHRVWAESTEKLLLTLTYLAGGSIVLILVFC